jgi:hypothetical protein
MNVGPGTTDISFVRAVNQAFQITEVDQHLWYQPRTGSSYHLSPIKAVEAIEQQMSFAQVSRAMLSPSLNWAWS